MSGDIGQEIGNYRLVRLLGQGSFANVYLGEDTRQCTQVAMKVLRWRLFGNEATSFRNDAQRIRQLVHPNIVHLLDFGIDDTMPYLVMDYIQGGTLRQRHLHGDPLPSATLCPFVTQIATALQYAHDRGLVHRNVRPENILIGANNKVLVSDFGIELEMQSIPSQPRRKELTGIIAYMAPEQLQDEWCAASDQYALGIMVYEWLTGSLPFQGTFLEVASQQLLTPVPSLREKVSALSPVIDKVVLKALCKDPSNRFASIREFAFALEQTCKISGARRSAVTVPLPAINIEHHTTKQPSTQHSSQHAVVRPAEQTPVQRSRPQPSLSGITTTEQATLSPKLPTREPQSFAKRSTTPTRRVPFEVTGHLVEPNTTAQQSTGKHLRQAPIEKPPTATSPVPTITNKALGSASPASMSDGDPFKFRINRPMLLLMVFLVILLAIGSPTLIFYLFHNHVAVAAPHILTPTAESRAQEGITTPMNTATPAVAQAAINPYSKDTSVLDLDDPLQSDKYNWQKSSDLATGSSCTFSNRAYQVAMPSKSAGPCFAEATDYRDFTYQIQMSIITTASPSSGGGIVFRGNKKTQHYYVFEIYASGLFTFDICSNSTCTRLKGSSANQQSLPSFNKVLGQRNTIAVVAKGESFSIYLNQQRIVGPVQDATSAEGMIGVFADGGNGAGGSQGATVAFSDAKVWKM